MIKNKTITCEYVGCGHPDKLADRISESILSAYYNEDRNVRAGIEVLVKDNIVVLSGEIKTDAYVDVDILVRNIFDTICYPKNHHLTGNDIKIINLIGTQSQEISNGVDKEDGTIGAGDQGFVVGYANNETEDYMPLGIYISKEICKELYWKEGVGPDMKSQVIIDYNDEGVGFVKSILVSSMHLCSLEQLKYNVNEVIKSITFNKSDDFNLLINPCGEWKIGGPISDCGVTGRKIVVDQFGGYCNVGGGNINGKDMSKVDRSGAYMARYLAKNIVASGIATSAKVELSFIISNPNPSSVNIELEDSKVNIEDLKEWIIKNIDMSVNGIIKRFGRNNYYQFTSIHGHYGNKAYPWEQIDLVYSLKKDFNI